MTFRHGTNRAAGPDDADGSGGSPADSETTSSESGAVDHESEGHSPTDDQYREWRRWIVEEFLTADYAVVPVDHLVETIRGRDPEKVDSERLRVILTGTVLPALDRQSVLEYDTDRELLINYGN